VAKQPQLSPVLAASLCRGASPPHAPVVHSGWMDAPRKRWSGDVVSGWYRSVSEMGWGVAGAQHSLPRGGGTSRSGPCHIRAPHNELIHR
jgi:hypothetical protein